MLDSIKIQAAVMKEAVSISSVQEEGDEMPKKVTKIGHQTAYGMEN